MAITSFRMFIGRQAVRFLILSCEDKRKIDVTNPEIKRFVVEALHSRSRKRHSAAMHVLCTVNEFID